MTRRILLVVVTVTVLAIAAFFVPTAIAIRSANERGELLELQREASIVAGRVPATGPIDADVLRPIVNSEHRMGLYDRDGALLGGDGPTAGDSLVQFGTEGNWVEGRVEGNLVAVVPLRSAPDGSSMVMRIEAPSTSNGFMNSAIVLLAVFALAIISLAVAVAMWLARRVNRPLDALRTWASTADDRPDLEPPAVTGIPEIDALRASLVERRTRIEELLRRERSFSSHVSHQLRTPVAAMRIAVETEIASPRDDRTAVLTESLGQLDRLESTITSLLALARNQQRPTTSVSLDRCVAEHVAHWRPVASRVGRDIQLAAVPTSARADHRAIGHILDVLIDNAVRHGTGSIRVQVSTVDRSAVVDVADDGPPPVDRDPFADVGTDSSHGIGLRLARALAESSDGRLALADAPTTTFRLTLPATFTERLPVDDGTLPEHQAP